MSKPEDVSQAAWDEAVPMAEHFWALHPKDVPDTETTLRGGMRAQYYADQIARALDAARAEGAKAEREAMEALLKNPVAVRLNVMRGGIDASSVIMDEREACAQVADTAPIETFATPRDIEATRFARTTIAAAIRSRP